MRIYKSFFRFEKCRKACKYRLYRLMRTYKEIVKNYILIWDDMIEIYEDRYNYYNSRDNFNCYPVDKIVKNSTEHPQYIQLRKWYQ